MIIQSQGYRWTDCICLIDSPIDYLSLILLSGFAIYGFLVFIWEIKNGRKNTPSIKKK